MIDLVHKVGMLLRPIVSCKNTRFSALTKECGRILTPLVGKTHPHIQDSLDLVKKLEDKVIPPGFTLVSFDVSDMYTNINQGPTLELVREKLEGDRIFTNILPLGLTTS